MTTEKANLIEFINAYACAKASGNQTLINMSLKVLDIQLSTLPDNWTPVQPTTAPAQEPAITEESEGKQE